MFISLFRLNSREVNEAPKGQGTGQNSPGALQIPRSETTLKADSTLTCFLAERAARLGGQGWSEAGNDNRGPSPGLATSLLCDLAQITEPLWTSTYSAPNERTLQ